MELVKKELSLEEEIQESKRLLLQYAVKNQFQEAIIPIDFTSVFKMLDRELSALPNPHPMYILYTIFILLPFSFSVQENPPPFLQTPVVIGEQPPKPLADKKKIQPKPPKKTQLKKGEKVNILQLPSSYSSPPFLLPLSPYSSSHPPPLSLLLFSSSSSSILFSCFLSSFVVVFSYSFLS